MFDLFTKSKFYIKCKLEIKLTKRRIGVIKNKRNAMQKYLRNDIADLLKTDLHTNAYGRAEGLLVELNLSSCYDLLEQFCVQIYNNISAMDKQRECPEDCREAVSSVVFAAARIADIPELRDLRTIFTNRYGNSLDCFVNKIFVEKLKSEPPTNEMKLQLMQDIATELGINWNSKAMEHKLCNAPSPMKDIHVDKRIREVQVNGESNPVPPSYNKSKVVPEPREVKQCENESVEKSKPKPVSVRKIRAKPVSDGDDVRKEKKDNHNEIDEEERKLDKLLMHYSQKKSPREIRKSESVIEPPPQQEAKALSNGSESKTGPVQPEMLNPKGIVHPKLPDYDDFVAQLAAFKRGD